MKLNNAVLSQSLPGYALPQYDRQAMARRSRQQPTWLHFGAGNLFRAFPAVLAQRLLNAGETDTGVLCCEAYDTDAVTQFLRPYDDLTLSVSLLADGSMEKEVVGSIAQSLTLPQDRCRVEEIFRAPSLQMVSFTITEKGYAVNAAVKEDMGRAPGEAQTLLGALAACCLARFEEYYEKFLQTEDLSLLMEEYNSLLINRGRTVQVQEPEGNWRGTALGIDREGCLLVEKEEGSVEKVFAGEVSVRGVYGYV